MKLDLLRAWDFKGYILIVTSIKASIYQDDWTEYAVANNEIKHIAQIKPFERGSSDTSVSFSFLYNTDLYNYLVNNVNVKCRVEINTGIIFEGTIENKFSLSRTRSAPKTISISVVAPTYLLRKKHNIIKKYTSKSPAYIINDLLSIVNMSLNSIPGELNTPTLNKAFDLNETSPLDIIDTLLYECGYCSYSGYSDGMKLILTPIKNAPANTIIFSEKQSSDVPPYYSLIDECTVSKQDRQADEISIKYYDTLPFTNSILFQETTGATNIYKCYITLAPDSYYQGNDAGVYLDLTYNNAKSESFDIYEISSASLTLLADPDIIIEEQYLTGNNRYFVKIKNNGTTPQTITRFEVKGSGKYKTTINFKKTIIGEGSNKVEYEMGYICDATKATNLCQSLSQLYKYSQFVASWKGSTPLIGVPCKLYEIQGLGTFDTLITSATTTYLLGTNTLVDFQGIFIADLLTPAVTSETIVTSPPVINDIVNNPQVPSSTETLVGEDTSIVYTDADDDDVVLRLGTQENDNERFLAIEKRYKDTGEFKEYGNLRLNKIMLDTLQVESSVSINNIESYFLNLFDPTGNLSALNVAELYIKNKFAIGSYNNKPYLSDGVKKTKYTPSFSGSATGTELSSNTDYSYNTSSRRCVLSNYVVTFYSNYLIWYNRDTPGTVTFKDVADITGLNETNMGDIYLMGTRLYILLTLQRDTGNGRYDVIKLYYTDNLSTFTLYSTLNFASSHDYTCYLGTLFKKGHYLACCLYDTKQIEIKSVFFTPPQSANPEKTVADVQYLISNFSWTTSDYFMAFDMHYRRVVVLDSSYNVYKTFTAPANFRVILGEHLSINMIRVNGNNDYNSFVIYGYLANYLERGYLYITIDNTYDNVYYDWIPSINTTTLTSSANKSVMFYGIEPRGCYNDSIALTRDIFDKSSSLNVISPNFNDYSNSDTVFLASMDENYHPAIFSYNISTKAKALSTISTLSGIKCNIYKNKELDTDVVLIRQENALRIYYGTIGSSLTESTIAISVPYGYTSYCADNKIFVRPRLSSMESGTIIYIIDMHALTTGGSVNLLSMELPTNVILMGIVAIDNEFCNFIVKRESTDQYLTEYIVSTLTSTIVYQRPVLYLSTYYYLSQQTSNNTTNYKNAAVAYTQASINKKLFRTSIVTITCELMDIGLGITTSGSNSNGSWVTFSNKFTIAYGYSLDVTAQLPNEYGSLYQNTVVINLPITFASSPTVTLCKAQWETGASWGYIASTTTSSFTMRVIDVIRRSYGNIKYSYIAIGYI